MTCTSKFFVRNPKTGDPMQIPCGKCMACRIAKTREWTVRLIHELSCWDKSCFATLTYSDENLPADGSINKYQLQCFFKRLRKDVKNIKYYACGEYGELYNRPHYHAIIFGVNFDEKEIIEENWKFGFVTVGTVTADSCQYVCGYIRKKLDGLMGRIAYGPRDSPFNLVSKGLGSDWLKRSVDQITSQQKCTVHGKNYGVPLYYRRKLGDEFRSVLAQKCKDEERREEDELTKRIPKELNDLPPDDFKLFEKIIYTNNLKDRILDLKRKTLEAQVGLYKRKDF